MEHDELEKTVQKNQWVLEQISERNFELHKELVELIMEKCEVRRIVLNTPKSAAGIKKQLEAEKELDRIEKRIEEIVSKAER
jgi:RNase H-fold protein (predicted Holliday junction resolvase)